MPFILVLFVAFPAGVASLILERRRKSRPGLPTLPYAWGYFQGCSGLIMGVYALLFVPFSISSGSAEPSAWLVLLALSAVWGPAGYFVIKRRRWAWIVHTVASFNPLWWIINTVYARHRWAEFEVRGDASIRT